MSEIKRDFYLNKLINKRENGMVKIITGIRRSGKSYLLFELFYKYLLSVGVKQECVIKLALDDEDNKQYRDPDNLYPYLKNRITNDKDMFYILLDEAQLAISEEELKGKEPIRLYGILNGLLHRRNVDVYITGSNSK